MCLQRYSDSVLNAYPVCFLNPEILEEKCSWEKYTVSWHMQADMLVLITAIHHSFYTTCYSDLFTEGLILLTKAGD